jgi:hypothetical protein
MRALVEGTTAQDLQIKGGLRYGTTQLAISGAFVIPPTLVEPVIWSFVPTGAQNIQLPPIVGALIPMEGRVYRIANQAASAISLTAIRDPADGGGTVGTVAQNVITEFVVVNGVWMAK